MAAAISERPLSDCQTCRDGTTFTVHSELVRGEPRWYWVMRRDGGTEEARSVGPDGSLSRRTAQRLARRLAVDYDAAEPPKETRQ